MSASKSSQPQRLYYLDWLQVLAVFGVFLFHATFTFSDIADWHIKNLEKSTFVTLYSLFFLLWAMAFFYLMAGATSWFSLQRRTSKRYIKERVNRLLVPYILGSILLTPIQAYYELTHRSWWSSGSFFKFLIDLEAWKLYLSKVHPISFSSTIFGQIGYHLWFIADSVT